MLSSKRWLELNLQIIWMGKILYEIYFDKFRQNIKDIYGYQKIAHAWPDSPFFNNHGKKYENQRTEKKKDRGSKLACITCDNITRYHDI